MTDRSALQQLLQKYVDDSCTEEEKKVVEQWYELLDDETIPELKEEEVKLLEGRLWKNIQTNIEPAGQKVVIRQMWFKWVAAACVIGLLLASYFVFIKPDSQENWISYEKSGDLIEKSNKTAFPLRLTLTDSSTVTLQPGASVSFPSHFTNGKREVYLNGEAFFEVQKNPAQPFLVYNEKVITKVLGTSFNVKSLKNENNIEVSVLTGRVEVFENPVSATKNTHKTNNSIILVPNQKGIYSSKAALFTTTLVDSPMPLINEPIVFNDEMMSKVVSTFKRVYGVEILLDNNNLKKCTVTGDFTNQSFYTQLDLICRAINASYLVKSTTVLIKGKGCK